MTVRGFRARIARLENLLYQIAKLADFEPDDLAIHLGERLIAIEHLACAGMSTANLTKMLEEGSNP